MNGVLIIDKPAGLTSHDVVARVRQITGEKSIGHLGTLDPIATGVLPLVLGKFSRLAQFFQADEKEYEGVIRWGWSTDTYDAAGIPTSSPTLEMLVGGQRMEVPMFKWPALDAMQKAAATFVGEIDQIPPPFSAKKIAGVPAYKKARRGEKVELAAKRVRIDEFEIKDAVIAGQSVYEAWHAIAGDRHPEMPLPSGEPPGPFDNFLVSPFRVRCGAGTYVRSLVHDVGQKLRCGAHILELKRTRSGEFTIAQAVTLDDLKDAHDGDFFESDHATQTHKRLSIPDLMIHPREILKHMPAVVCPPEALGKLQHGNAVNLPFFPQPGPQPSPLLVRVFRNQDDLIAIAQRVAGTLFHPKVVLI